MITALVRPLLAAALLVVATLAAAAGELRQWDSAAFAAAQAT